MNIADFIRERLEKVQGPRSLVEIGLGRNEDVALRDWASRVRPLDLERDPRSFALAFLACATVAARERAGEHELWPHVRAWFPSKEAAPLFTKDRDLPCTGLREAIERTARYHDLRHAFDRNEGEHRWYVTVLLQCGFTRPGLARLPEWLAGRSSWRAVELLLHDPGLASTTFAAVFERLRGVRLGWYEDAPPSPWLEGDLNRLACTAARTSLSLGTSAAGPPPAPGVRLVDVAGGGLGFRVPLTVPASVVERGLPRIDFELGGRRGPHGLLQADGSYFALPADEVRLAEVPDRGTVQLRIVSPEGLALHEEDVVLFAGEEDVDFFSSSGHGQYRRASDPWTDFAPPSATILRVADDLPLRGQFAASLIHAGRSRWQRVAPDEMGTVEVPLGEELAWTFLVDERMRWPGRIEIVGDGRRWSPGTEIGWTVLTAPRARIRSARLGRHPLKVNDAGDGTCRVTLSARPSLPPSFALRLRIEDAGRQFTVAWPAPPPPCRHLFTRHDDGWRVAQVEDLTSLARPVRWFSGEVADGDTPWLFEGGRPVLPLGDREVLLGPRLSGYGAPLCVEGRRFNRDGPHIIVCSALEGVRCLGTLESKTGRTQLRFSPGFPWRDVFDLTVLSDDGIPRRLTADEYTVEHDRIELRGEVLPAAVAVTCRGDVVAATFSGRLHRVIDLVPEVGECVRWLFEAHAPLALPTVRDALVRAACRQPLAAVALSFGESRPTEGTALPAPRRDEFLLGFWRECLEIALPAIDGALGAESGVADLLLDSALNPFAAPGVEIPGNSVAFAVSRLAQADPVVAARVLQAAGRSPDKALVRVLRGARAELRATTTAPSLVDIANLLGVDERFVFLHRQTAVDWALGRTLPGERQENIRRLLYLPEFRQAVAADAIGRLTTEEPDARRRPGHR